MKTRASLSRSSVPVLRVLVFTATCPQAFTWNHFKILTDCHTLRQCHNSKLFAHLNSQIRIQLEFALVDLAIGSLAQGVAHVKQVQGEDVRVPVLERFVLVSSSS